MDPDTCCAQMARQLTLTCETHSDLAACPDSLIVRTRHDYGIRIHDGGSGFLVIAYCPWCGQHL
ncbi:DUF6980 family protein [Nocardioides speluncae]|uniref:DUF6980 family protein n=1 Tax=Nocardioides speluncae TaxID=2670337 RepID=UPI000D6902D2|nr:hypothetical protein [Nocardioides speluncae]